MLFHVVGARHASPGAAPAQETGCRFVVPAIVGEGTAGPGDALTVRTSHRQNGKRFRLVIARPRRGRGNLGKAVTLIAPAIVGERTAGPGDALTVRTRHRQNGKRFRFVIARSEATWQSRRTEPDPRKTIGEIVTAFPRLPRARSALAMTNLRTLHR